jgi:hypothetical protein
MSLKRILSVLTIATVLHTGVLAARPARASTGTDVAIGVAGFFAYLGIVFLATTLWNRSKLPDTTNNFTGSAIDPATLDRHARPDGVRGPWACKPDAAGLTLVCW